MGKNKLRTYGVLAIIFVVFSVLVFAVPFVKNGVFVLSYLFVLLAMVFQGYAIYKAFSREEPVTSKLYGFPVARIGFAYLVVQTIASVIFMAFGAILPLWVALVVKTTCSGSGASNSSASSMRHCSSSLDACWALGYPPRPGEL